MSYQVIARKYRPRTLSDLTGQEHITRALRHALDGGRLHHAYLFSGVRGTGKTTTARILARGLNCHRGITSNPCLECPSCREIGGGNSMDVLEIDAASNTGVDNVREVIINNIAMAPARDRYKVFVIDEVHMLSTSAFNALLKTLEEPPSHVVFIMATTELHKVPDTILSRCQQFEFRQIPTEQILGRLKEIANEEGITISDDALREVARAGAGSLRDAQSAFDQVIAFSGTTVGHDDVVGSLGLISAATLARCTSAIANGETAEILQLVDEIFSRGYDARNFTREMMGWFRNLLLLRSGIGNNELPGVSDSEVAGLKELAPRFSEADIVRAFHLLTEVEKEIKDSPQPRFQLELGLVRLAQLRRLQPLEELVRRLEELEARIGGAAGVALPPPPARESAPRGAEPRNLRPPTPVAPPVAAPVAPPVAAPVFAADTEPFFDESEPEEVWATEPAPSVSRVVSSAAPTPHPPSSSPPSGGKSMGREVEAILGELQRINRGFILTAIEEAQQLEYRDGRLIATFGRDDSFAKRIRESGTLFKTVGEAAIGKPVKIEVRISGQTEKVIDEEEQQRARLHERALRIPAVRQFLEESRGEIVWVREPEKS